MSKGKIVVPDGAEIAVHSTNNANKGTIVMNGQALSLSGQGSDIYINSGNNILFQGPTATIGGKQVGGSIISLGKSGDTISLDVPGVTYVFPKVSSAMEITGDLLLSSTATTSPSILFNSSSGTDTGIDMAIRANGEALEFYEPEDSNKVHFKILDDTGVDAPYGYLVNGTTVIGSDALIDWNRLKNTPSYALTTGSTFTGMVTFKGQGDAGSTTFGLPADTAINIEHTSAGGSSSIYFKSTQNAPSDFAYIRFQDSTGAAATEDALLTIGVENDGAANDRIQLKGRTIINADNYSSDPLTIVDFQAASASKGTIDTSGNLSVVGGGSFDSHVNLANIDGLGYRFFDSDSYKIYMSSQGATGAGRLDTTSDYNMYFRMSAGTNRGFVFQNNTTNVAQIDASGNIVTTGTSIKMATSGADPSIEIGNGSAAGNPSLKLRSSGVEGWLWWNATADQYEFKNSNSTWSPIEASNIKANGILNVTGGVTTTNVEASGQVKMSNKYSIEYNSVENSLDFVYVG